MRRRTEITWEMEETVVVKRGATVADTFCPKCELNVKMMSPEILASLAGSDEREIFRLIEAGRIHFIEPGRILGCSGCCRRLFGLMPANAQHQEERLFDQGTKLMKKEKKGHEE